MCCLSDSASSIAGAYCNGCSACCLARYRRALASARANSRIAPASCRVSANSSARRAGPTSRRATAHFSDRNCIARSGRSPSESPGHREPPAAAAATPRPGPPALPHDPTQRTFHLRIRTAAARSLAAPAALPISPRPRPFRINRHGSANSFGLSDRFPHRADGNAEPIELAEFLFQLPEPLRQSRQRLHDSSC